MVTRDYSVNIEKREVEKFRKGIQDNIGEEIEWLSSCKVINQIPLANILDIYRMGGATLLINYSKLDSGKILMRLSGESSAIVSYAERRLKDISSDFNWEDWK